MNKILAAPKVWIAAAILAIMWVITLSGGTVLLNALVWGEILRRMGE